MSARTLVRLTAVALMAAAVLFAVGVPRAAPPPDVTVVPQLLAVGFGLLLLVGVAGLYARQHRQAGLLGLVGVALIVVGTVFMTSFSFVGAFLLPVLAEGAPELLQRFPEDEWQPLLAVNLASRVAFAAGWVLFGIAAWRAGVLPRWSIAAAAAAAVLQIGYLVLPPPVGVAVLILLALGVFGLGWGLWASVAIWPHSATPTPVRPIPSAGQDSGHHPA